MESAAQPEQLNPDGFAAFSDRAGDGSPVVMPAPLLGGDAWDLVALVEYPTRQAFLEMIGSPEYQAIAHLRTEALAAGELHPMDAGGGA